MTRTQTEYISMLIETTKIDLVDFQPGQLIMEDSGDVYYDPTTGTELEHRVKLIDKQQIADKQDKTDDSLTTTDKTITGAINELKDSIKTELLDKLGVQNGIATLGDDSKVPIEQLPDTILGSVTYKGVWNAADGTTGDGSAIPTATADNKGWYYITTVPGEWNSMTFEGGDWLISDGAEWSRVDTSCAVTSVNGKVGNITITAVDVGLGNVTNESKTTMFTNPTFTGTVTIPTQVITDDSTKAASTAFVHDLVDDEIGKVNLHKVITTGSSYTGSKLLEMKTTTAAGKLGAGVLQLTSISGEVETTELKIDVSSADVISGTSKVKNAINSWLGTLTSVPTLSAVLTAGNTVADELVSAAGTYDMTLSVGPFAIEFNCGDGTYNRIKYDGISIMHNKPSNIYWSELTLNGLTVENDVTNYTGYYGAHEFKIWSGTANSGTAVFSVSDGDVQGNDATKAAFNTWLGTLTSVPTWSDVLTAGSSVSTPSGYISIDTTNTQMELLSVSDTSQLSAGTLVVVKGNSKIAKYTGEGIELSNAGEVLFSLKDGVVSGSEEAKNSFNSWLGHNIVRITE